jgi:hypothetical protein
VLRTFDAARPHVVHDAAFDEILRNRRRVENDDKWFNKKDGEQAFPSLAVAPLSSYRRIDDRARRQVVS